MLKGLLQSLKKVFLVIVHERVTALIAISVLLIISLISHAIWG